MSFINRFREYVNLKIFSSKIIVLNIIKVQSVLLAIMALSLLIYSFGYPQVEENLKIQIFFLKFIFGFYFLNYFVRFFYTFEPVKFLKKTWLEWSILIIILIEAITDLTLNRPLIYSIIKTTGSDDLTHWYLLTLQFVLLILLLIDLAKIGTLLDLLKIKPSTLFIFSFLILISSGTGLLMLPEMTVNGKGATFLESLFTSTSASCVTGLIVVDTATYFTFKGQLIIMILIQLGGLNIISFATFFASFYSGGVGLRHHSMMQDYFSSESLLDAKGLLRQIISLSLLIELIGAAVIFSLWNPDITFKSVYEKIYFSVFHSISAFNNAGFSIWTNGLMHEQVKASFILHLAFAGLIFFGSLGFSSIRDIFGFENMRQRMMLPWKKFRLSTQIALYSSFSLIIFGAVLFYFLEKNNSVSDQKPMEQVITSIFQSVTCRTTGFNTVDVSLLHSSTLLLFIFLMFIGASSGSTGGGIKTSTFTLLFLSAFSTIRGKRNVEMYRHTIAWELLNKAYSILIFSATFIFTATFILTLTEPETEILQLMFEEVSAFSTVGLSTGITAGLSDAGKYIIILSMFVGRIGTLTIAVALSQKVKTINYKYPTAHVMVG